MQLTAFSNSTPPVTNSIQGAFKALSKSHTKKYMVYLLIDKHSRSKFPDEMRLRNDIFNVKYPIFFL